VIIEREDRTFPDGSVRGELDWRGVAVIVSNTSGLDPFAMYGIGSRVETTAEIPGITRQAEGNFPLPVFHRNVESAYAGAPWVLPGINRQGAAHQRSKRFFRPPDTRQTFVRFGSVLAQKRRGARKKQGE
jgi:hypothetical protein